MSEDAQINRLEDRCLFCFPLIYLLAFTFCLHYISIFVKTNSFLNEFYSFEQYFKKFMYFLTIASLSFSLFNQDIGS